MTETTERADVGPPPDAHLWDLIAQGDHAAFAELFERHAEAVWNYAYRLTASPGRRRKTFCRRRSRPRGASAAKPGLGITEPSVRARVSRTRARLRDLTPGDTR